MGTLSRLLNQKIPKKPIGPGVQKPSSKDSGVKRLGLPKAPAISRRKIKKILIGMQAPRSSKKKLGAKLPKPSPRTSLHKGKGSEASQEFRLRRLMDRHFKGVKSRPRIIKPMKRK